LFSSPIQFGDAGRTQTGGGIFISRLIRNPSYGGLVVQMRWQSFITSLMGCVNRLHRSQVAFGRHLTCRRWVIFFVVIPFLNLEIVAISQLSLPPPMATPLLDWRRKGLSGANLRITGFSIVLLLSMTYSATGSVFIQSETGILLTRLVAIEVNFPRLAKTFVFFACLGGRVPALFDFLDQGRAAVLPLEFGHFFSESESQSRGDCIIQPRVARNELPWGINENASSTLQGLNQSHKYRSSNSSSYRRKRLRNSS